MLDVFTQATPFLVFFKGHTLELQLPYYHFSNYQTKPYDLAG